MSDVKRKFTFHVFIFLDCDIIFEMPTYLPNAEPFFFEGNHIGCLLIHGFTGTPYEMRGLGAFLSQTFNYTVSGPALAGHATCVEDCARTTWQNWYASVEREYELLKARGDQVFAIGLSLGGALALHLAAHEPLAGVVSVAAPIYYKHRLEFFFRAFPFLFQLIPYVKKNYDDDDTQDPDVRAIHPAYEHNPTRAARSLIKDFLPHLRGELRLIQTPALLLHSRADRTVPPHNMQLIYDALGSRDKRMVWLERGGHLVLEDYGKDEAFKLIADFIREQSSPRVIAAPAAARVVAA